MIYTGYYHKMKEYQEAGLVTCSISQGVYKFGTVDTDLNCFKPSWKMVKEDYTETEYRNYCLKKLNPQQIVNNLKKMFGNRNFVLLCYEANPMECHRSFVSKWFRENGIPCEEYQVERKPEVVKPVEPKKSPKGVQFRLF